MIEIPLSPWEQAFGLSVNVWLRPKRLQGIFHIESIMVEDIIKKLRGRVVGVPLLYVVLKGAMEWVNPYISRTRIKHKTRQKTYKQGAMTPGYIYAHWPCRDYKNIADYRAGDITEKLTAIKVTQFIPDKMADTSITLELIRDDEPMPLEFLERTTYWDGERWRLRE